MYLIVLGGNYRIRLFGINKVIDKDYVKAMARQAAENLARLASV
jgi:hypothetical protein